MLRFPIYILLAVTSTSTQAFNIVRTSLPTRRSTIPVTFQPSVLATGSTKIISKTLLFEGTSDNNDEKVDDETTTTEVVEEEEESATDEEDKDDNEEEEAEEEAEKEPEEDPEITSLKEQISTLESQLKQKNRDLNNIQSLSDNYTKGGYARKVAEMESFRRSQNAASVDNVTAARALALQNFLPILEKLQEINEKYDGDEFAKSYNALSWDFKNALKDMGVEEFTVKEGDKVDGSRIVAVREEYSDSFEKGTVIEPVEIGYEIDGNVMRAASAVVSLGTEEEVEEAATTTDDDEAASEE